MVLVLRLALLGMHYGKTHGKHFAMLQVGGVGLLHSGVRYSVLTLSDVIGLFSPNAGSFSRNGVPKRRMLSVPAIYAPAPL